MSTLINLWVAAPILGSALALQWAVLRTIHRNGLARQRARHAHQEQTASGHFEQAKRQIGQLQEALTVAKQQPKPHTTVGAAPAKDRARTRDELQQTLDAATALRRRLPPEAFPDTLPSLQFPYDNLLMR